MEKLAERLTCYVLSKKVNEKNDYDIIKYGFQVGIEVATCISASITVAIYLHMLIELLLLLGVIVIIRSYGGGLHLNNFTSCFWCSCSVMIGILVFIKYCIIQSNIAWVMLIMCLSCIWGIGPVESKSKPLDSLEKIHFSKRLGIGLIEILGISIVLQISGKEIYVSLVSVTMLVVMLSMIAGKIKNRILKVSVS